MANTQTEALILYMISFAAPVWAEGAVLVNPVTGVVELQGSMNMQCCEDAVRIL